ncbi:MULTISPECIES: ribosome silencing factor [Gilvibacter]|uniref:ribosome silencing factor n=1 Tax=Gilvibacter TaxID=379070 RepID=UPI00234FC2CB|nr:MULTISPECIES: ribosome silencing factor [Gilvibacter]MDC7998528.1 ribosome silencing factor [Gilvibacter sediminis]NQX76580.1 ribosome silencing factor [Gilvibacter sp.]
MSKKEVGTDQLITQIIRGIEEVKGQDIEILDLREIENTVCDYFIICNGTSNTQVNAIVNSVQKSVSKELREKPWHTEGTENAEWVLIDYVHVVVHVFQKHIREFYDIEGLWGDAHSIKIESTY